MVPMAEMELIENFSLQREMSLLMVLTWIGWILIIKWLKLLFSFLESGRS
jgi:hypothetical protein